MTATNLEELEANGFEAIPEIIWEETTMLRPGVDYRDGVVYFTIPARFNETKTEGRGKAAKEVVVQVDDLAAVSSKGETFRFTPENVAARGFTFPEQVTMDKDRRWSAESIRDFTQGRTTAPDPATLHSGIRSVYEQYVEFAREDYYDVMPLFIMGSYLFRLFQAIGYIHFNGTAASGKSQNLRILDALGLNTVWASSMSAAALYRQLAGNPGLVCIDEAEGFEGERGEELRRILNGGYLDGQKVRRVEKGKNDNFVVAGFDSYGPKAIASINPLDYVIGSRCLIVEMTPAIRPIPEFDKNDPRWQRLRDRLYLFAMYHSEDIFDLVQRWNDDYRHTRASKLISRQWQITQTYIVLADYIDRFDQGNRCERLITFFNEYFARQQQQQDATDRIRIVLKALPRVIAEFVPIDGHYYRMKDIHSVASSYLEEDAKEYFKTRTLGKNLDSLGFKTKRAKKDGTQVWLDPEVVRKQFRQRRVEPHDEDVAWLNGEVEYTPAYTQGPSAPAPMDDMWASIADAEEQP